MSLRFISLCLGWGRRDARKSYTIYFTFYKYRHPFSGIKSKGNSREQTEFSLFQRIFIPFYVIFSVHVATWILVVCIREK